MNWKIRLILFVSLIVAVFSKTQTWEKEQALTYNSLFSSYYYPDKVKVLLNKKDYLSVVEVSVQILDNLKNLANKKRVKKILFDAYLSLGDVVKAVDVYQQYKETNEELTKEEKNALISLLNKILIKSKSKEFSGRDLDIFYQAILQLIDDNKTALFLQKVASFYLEKRLAARAIEVYKSLFSYHRYVPSAQVSYAVFVKIYLDKINQIDNINYRYLLNKYFLRIFNRSSHLTQLPKLAQTWEEESLLEEPLSFWSSFSLKKGAQKYFWEADFYRAHKAYERIYLESKSRINQAFAKFNQAEALFFGKDYERAIKEFDFLIKSYPDFIDAKEVSQIRKGQLVPYKFEKKLWKKDKKLLISDGFLSTTTYLNSGDSYYRQKKYAKAAQAYGVLYNLSQRNSHNEKQAQFLAAQSWLLAGNYVKAYNIYRQILPRASNKSNQYKEILQVMFNIVDEVYRIYRDKNIEKAVRLEDTFKAKSKIGKFIVDGLEEISDWLFAIDDMEIFTTSSYTDYEQETIYRLHESMIELVPFHPRIPEYFVRLASLHLEKYNTFGAESKDIESAIDTMNKMVKTYRGRKDAINEGKGRVNLAEINFLYLRGNADEEKVDNAKVQLEFFVENNSLHPDVRNAQVLLNMIDEWKAQRLYDLAKFYEDETLLRIRLWPFIAKHEKLFERLDASKRYLAKLLVDYPNSKIAPKARELKKKIDKLISQKEKNQQASK